jgi:hypothetical protein
MASNQLQQEVGKTPGAQIAAVEQACASDQQMAGDLDHGIA